MRAVAAVMEPLDARYLMSTTAFQPPVQYPAPLGPASVASGDFNGDGKADLVASFTNGNGGDTQVGIYLNHGDGTFANPVFFNAGSVPQGVRVADLNGDGKSDLAVVDFNGGVSVLLGNGDGTFQSAVNYATPSYLHSLVVADLNGDGKPDLVVTNEGQNLVTVFLNRGDGTFTNAGDTGIGTGAFEITAGDFNHDGKTDLAIGTDHGLRILLGHGDGTFASVVTYGNALSVGGLITGDFNHDGRTDVIMGTSDGMQVFLGKGDGSFQAPVHYAVGPDIAMTDPFTQQVISTRPDGAVDLVEVDFNHSGKPDLAVMTDGGLDLLADHGDGTFGAPRQVMTSHSARETMVAADFNGDGTTDLAITDYFPNSVDVLIHQHLSVTGLAATGLARKPLTNIPLAQFTGAESHATAADYTATVQWGDGTSGAATIAVNPAGGFQILGTHTYTAPGRHIATIALNDSAGSSFTATATVTIRSKTQSIVSRLWTKQRQVVHFKSWR